MSTATVFPYNFKADGIAMMPNGTQARRRSGYALIKSGAISHPVVDSTGAAIAVDGSERVTYISLSLLTDVSLAAAGVVKAAFAANADAASASVPAAQLRTDDTTVMQAATAFAANASGYSLILPAASTTQAAGPLAIYGRDAGNTADVAIAPAAGEDTAVVAVEIFTISRKPAIAAEDIIPTLPRDVQRTLTRTIDSL